MKSSLLFIVAFIISTSSYSQIDSLFFKAHQEDIKDLYNYRGAPPSWLKTGNVSMKDITSLLREYNDEVGVLIYTYKKNGSLNISLIDKNGTVNTSDISINENEFINKITQVNQLFSSSFSKSLPNRGAILSSEITKKKKEELLKNFDETNTILFPTSLNFEKYNHLIIVPTLNIGSLPLAGFKIKDKFLIDYLSYSIAPSLYELMISYKTKTLHSNLGDEIYYFWENALFVANPQYPTNIDISFPNLPGTEDEVNYVVKVAKPEKTTLLKGLDASKNNVLESICNRDLLYFATHGISDLENPMEGSYLVLTNRDNSYKLTLREIMNIRKECKLKADLVVLSACNTGTGKAISGGIVGLARAFQIAGAKNVLMSLWNIDDKETATLMKLFFDNLQQAKTLQPHESFRNAILTYKKDINPDPKYWAAFSIFGIPN